MRSPRLSQPGTPPRAPSRHLFTEKGERGKTQGQRRARANPGACAAADLTYPDCNLRRRECLGQTEAADDPGANRSRLSECSWRLGALGGVPGWLNRSVWVYRFMFRGIEKGEQAPPILGSSWLLTSMNTDNLCP